MGNNKFKFSDMIPNAWFYKLKDMNKSSKKKNNSSPTKSHRSHSRYYYSSSHYEQNKACNKLFNTPIHTKDLNFPINDSLTMSSNKRASRKTIYKPSQVQSYQEHDLSSNENSCSESEFCDSFSVPDLLNCSCRVSSSTNDIIIDMNNESFQGNSKNLDGFDEFSQLGLAPILTKQVKFNEKIVEDTESQISTESDEVKTDDSFSIKVNQRRRRKSQMARKGSPNSQGIRLRMNSPKLVNRKIKGCGRKSVSRFVDGFAVVKSSIDPISDFKESMVEMIVENNIKGSKDLEDLLACYLSLNSSDYHNLIVKAFEQIWYDMAHLRM